MRPLQLIIEAFGPYLKKQVIDFSELKGRNFFLIHGPTGSGKTTILDAICYALYGKTSGDERDGARMRSSKAPADTLTSVTLDFKVSGKHYQIKRIPKQEIMAKRGGKLRTQNPQAILLDLTGVHQAGGNGLIIAEKVEKVNEIIEDIIGFKYDQFRQVVMLPQGKFQQFLAASSKEREAILEVLFQTNYYKLIESTLKEEAAAIEKKISAERSEIDFILLNFGAANFNELRDILSKLTVEYEAAVKKTAELKNSDSQISDTLKNAENLCLKFEKLGALSETINNLKSRETEINNLKRLLEMAKKAAPIEPIEEIFGMCSKKEKELSGAADSCRIKLETAKINLKTASQNYELSKSRLNDKKNLEISIDGLEKNLIDLDKLLKISARKKEIEIKSAGVKIELTDITAKSEAVQKSIDATSKMLSDAQNNAALVPALEKSYQKAENDYKGVLKINSLKKEAETHAKLFLEAADEENNSLKILNEAKIKLNEMESIFLESQAAIISAALKPGAPCPVCGSIDHPHPAAGRTGGIDKKIIDTHKKNIKNYEMQFEEARSKKTAAELKKVEIESAVSNLSESLKETVNQDIIILKAASAREKQLLETAVSTYQNLKELEMNLNSLNDQKKAAAESIEKKRDEIMSMESELFGSDAIIAELQSKVPKNFNGKKALNAEIEKLKTAVLTIDNEFKMNEESYNRINAENIKLTENLINITQNLETAKKERAFHFEKLNNSIIENGFSSIEDYAGYKQYIPKIKYFEIEIKKFDDDFNIANSSKTELENELKTAVKPDLTSIKNQAEEIKTAFHAALKDEERLNLKIGELKTNIKKIEETARSTEELNRRYQVTASLSTVAGGANRYNMTFQRFVQGAFLEEVLIAATRRLKIMSRGRYNLNRSAGVSDMRSSGGLELEVFDNYTGAARPVSTLSGGETFMASLALALGLADTVQSYSGGIKLDTIFIDEGFGSLDPESLDLAINVLTELFKGGRLVAIISHVPELRERIDARLEVSVTNNGESRAKFITL